MGAVELDSHLRDLHLSLNADLSKRGRAHNKKRNCDETAPLYIDL